MSILLKIQQSALIREAKLLEIYLSRSSKRLTGPKGKKILWLKTDHLQGDLVVCVVLLGEDVQGLPFAK